MNRNHESNHSLKSANQLTVEVFMAKMNQPLQPLPVLPTVPIPQVAELRGNLHLEETLELVVLGLGCDLPLPGGFVLTYRITPEGPELGIRNTETNEWHDLPKVKSDRMPDMIEIVDGCVDTEVINLGTAASCGVALQPLFDIGMNNNHLKFGPGHSRREDGKLVKPKGHPSPQENMKEALELQGFKF